jgi:hypothetical protein
MEYFGGTQGILKEYFWEYRGFSPYAIFITANFITAIFQNIPFPSIVKVIGYLILDQSPMGLIKNEVTSNSAIRALVG